MTEIDPADLAAANLLQQWMDGGPEGRTDLWGVYLGDGAEPDRLRDLRIAADGVVFAPPHLLAADLLPGDRRAVGVSGELVAQGGELSVGDSVVIQVEGYVAAEFLPEVYPTVVTVTDDADVELVLADVAAAREEGYFPPHLTDRMCSLLGERVIAGHGVASIAPATCFVDETGEVRRTPFGAALVVGPDGRLTTPDGSVLDPAVRRLLEAPGGAWAPRYVQALRVLRRLPAEGRRSVRVAGLGWEPDRSNAVEVPRPDAPLVLDLGGGVTCTVSATGAVRRVPDAVAAVVHTVCHGGDVPDDLLTALDVRRADLSDFLRVLDGRLQHA